MVSASWIGLTLLDNNNKYVIFALCQSLQIPQEEGVADYGAYSRF